MYTPPFNRVDDEDEVRRFVAAVRSGWLVTADADGVPSATLLPVLWRGPTVVTHLALANDHWRSIEPGSPGLLIVGGAEAYVSPSWYAAKAEHGKVVPTWNYTAAHLRGTLEVHRDAAWLRRAVTDLTREHEDDRESPWEVADAPDRFVEGQLRGIVGVELTVTSVEGKAKLSQNRSEADQRGVVDGLRDEPFAGAARVADAMEQGTP